MSERDGGRGGLLFVGGGRACRVKPGAFAIFLPRHLNYIWSTARSERREVSVYVEVPEDIRLKMEGPLVVRGENRVPNRDGGPRLH